MKRIFNSKNQITGQGRTTQSGFTLLELMIVLVLAAIIMTQAVPAFQTTLKNSRLTSQTNNLVADLNLARSEAIKRGKNVIVCSSSNPTASAATCASSATWTTGWLVFADDDSSGDYDNTKDTLIHVGMPATGSVTFVSTANATNGVIYTNEGLITSGTTVAIAVCDDRGVTSGGTTYGRQIEINTTGRPTLFKDSAASGMSCTAPAEL